MRVLLAICFWLGSESLGLAQEWKVGLGRANITPASPMPMAGYASRKDQHSEGKLTDLWAKTVVLEDAQGHQAALVTLDLVGIDRRLSQSICDAVCKAQQWDRSQIALCFSHTHTGPVVGNCLESMHYLQFKPEDQKLVTDYAKFLQESVLQSVQTAVTHMEKAEVSSGTGRTDFAVNRRNNREPEVPQLRAEGKLQGPVFHDVPVLVVRQNGNVTAAIFGYACHNTTLSLMEWSGDYAGYAQAELERQFPGCQAMYWAGCGADQNPLPRRKVEFAEQYGGMLAQAVATVLKGELTPIKGRLKTHYQEISLPLANLPTTETLQAEAVSTDTFVASRAKMFQAQLARGESLVQAYPYPVEIWELGDQVRFVFLGGEVVVDYVLRLQAENAMADQPVPQLWVAGYANDVMAYIPSRRVLQEGGYEGKSSMVYYGLPGTWSPDVEDLIISAAQAPIADR